MKKLEEYETPETDKIAHAGLPDLAYISEMTYKARKLERKLAMCRDALLEIAHCDDLVIRGENDHPEIIRRLRFAVNLSEETLETTEPK